jgi:hypothetical protein
VGESAGDEEIDEGTLNLGGFARLPNATSTSRPVTCRHARKRPRSVAARVRAPEEERCISGAPLRGNARRKCGYALSAAQSAPELLGFDSAVLEDAMEESGTDRLSGMNGHDRGPAVRVSQEVVAPL